MLEERIHRSNEDWISGERPQDKRRMNEIERKSRRHMKASSRRMKGEGMGRREASLGTRNGIKCRNKTRYIEKRKCHSREFLPKH